MATHTLILHLTAPGTFPGDNTVSLPGTFPLLRHIFTFIPYQMLLWHKKKCIYGCFKDLFDKSLNVSIRRGFHFFMLFVKVAFMTYIALFCITFIAIKTLYLQ